MSKPSQWREFLPKLPNFNKGEPQQPRFEGEEVNAMKVEEVKAVEIKVAMAEVTRILNRCHLSH